MIAKLGELCMREDIEEYAYRNFSFCSGYYPYALFITELVLVLDWRLEGGFCCEV